MSDLDIAVRPPDPTYVHIVASVIRGLLQIASGLGFAWGAWVTGDQAFMIASAIVMTATMIWSAYQKIIAVRRLHQAALSSAVVSADATNAAGKPVVIAVTDPKAFVV